MMEDIYKIMNDIDDNASLVKETRKLSESHSKISRRTRNLNESRKSLRENYSVKFGHHEKGEETFADLQSAINFINKEKDKYDHRSLVLYNDGKEMIWLDRMQDENKEDIGFQISRQDDKSLVFDAKKGLSVKQVEQDNKTVRSMIMTETQLMKHWNEAKAFSKMTFVEDKTKPSYLDLASNTIHYNPDEQLSVAIERYIEQLKGNKTNEAWDEEAPLGRHDLYPQARVKPWEDNVPQWVKDKYGPNAQKAWDDMRRNDRNNNSYRNPWESFKSNSGNVLQEADEEATSAPTNNNQKDTTSEKSNDSTDNVIDKLRQIGNYETFIKALKSLSAEQKELFRKEFGVVDAIKPSAQKTAIAATKLRPTQSEIDWKKSLSYGLTQDCSYFFKSPVELGMPVLTYKSTFIIDGHHRWSQVFMFNPKADVSCINFNYEQASPTDVLKDFQGAVLATTGNVAVGTAGTNIYSVNEDELRKYIHENISDACWQSLVKAKVAEDKNSAVEYLVGNAMILKNKVKPPENAPDRIDMPQTNNDVVTKAAKALSDMSEEFDDDIDSVLEGFWSNNEESPLGTHELYPETRVRPMEDNVPQWVKDKYGSNASSAWNNMRASDREFNKPYRP